MAVSTQCAQSTCGDIVHASVPYDMSQGQKTTWRKWKILYRSITVCLAFSDDHITVCLFLLRHVVCFARADRFLVVVTFLLSCVFCLLYEFGAVKGVSRLWIVFYFMRVVQVSTIRRRYKKKVLVAHFNILTVETFAVTCIYSIDSRTQTDNFRRIFIFNKVFSTEFNILLHKLLKGWTKKCALFILIGMKGFCWVESHRKL